MSKTIEEIVFARAYELVEQGWTRKRLACDRRGIRVGPTEPSAVRFCAAGALTRALAEMGFSGNEAFHLAVSMVGDEMAHTNLYVFNDRAKSKRVVLAWLKERGATPCVSNIRHEELDRFKALTG